MIERYLAEHNGDRVQSAVAMGRDLMCGHPASFKAGYTAPNAGLVVREAFTLSDEEAGAVNKLLHHDPTAGWFAATAEQLERIQLALWGQVVLEFPEVTTGDIDPIHQRRLSAAIKVAIDGWLLNNHPANQGRDTTGGTR